MLDVVLILTVLNLLLTRKVIMKVSETLVVIAEIKANLIEAKTEILAKLEELNTTDPDLSPEGAALVEEVRGISKGLADIVPNTVPPPVEPLVEPPTT
jgi:hypothetical protein